MRFAAIVAMSRTSVLAKNALYDEMRRVFVQPTPYTMRSLMARPATKEQPVSYVWLNDDAPKGTPAPRYLSPQIEGGTRQLKPSETRYQQNRLIARFGAGPFTVPGSDARLNQYGNQRPSEIVQVLSALQVMRDPYQNRTANSAKRNKRLRDFFLVTDDQAKKGRLPAGIYERRGQRDVRQIVRFVNKRPQYRPLFDFYGVGRRTVEARFTAELARAFEDAMRTSGQMGRWQR
jgi:hypothetical protein